MPLLAGVIGTILVAGVTPVAAAGTRAEGECGLPSLDDRCEEWTADGEPGTRVVASQRGDRLFTWGGPQIVARHAATGQQLWDVALAGIASSTAPVRGLAVSPDGTQVYAVADDNAAGSSSNIDRDLVVTARDAATGAPVWTRTLALPAIEENDRYVSREQGAAIAASPDGRRVYVAADTRLYDRILGEWVTNDDVVVAGYAATTGEREWLVTWGEAPEKYAEVHARFLTVSPDSRKLYLGGTHATCGLGPSLCPSDFLALAFRAYHPAAPAQEGNLLWDDLYNGVGGPDGPVAMDLAPDGSRLYFAGYSGGPAWPDGDFDWATVAYRTSTGSRAWVSRYEGPADGRPDPANRHYADGTHIPAWLVASPSGDTVFVTGTFQAHSIADIRALAEPGVVPGGREALVTGHDATVAYDAATGEQVWVRHFNSLTSVGAPALGPHHASPGTSAASLAVSPDGESVYVAGRDSGFESLLLLSTGNAEQVTAAYDASTGGQIWIARLPGHVGVQVDAAPGGTSLFTLSTDGAIHAYALP